MNVDLGHSVLETLTEYVTVCDSVTQWDQCPDRRDGRQNNVETVMMAPAVTRTAWQLNRTSHSEGTYCRGQMCGNVSRRPR